MAWKWQPDLANWAMFTPWPFNAPVPGNRRQGRDLRLRRKLQFRDPDHEPEAMSAGRVARPRDEQLPPILHAKGRCLITPGGGTGFKAALSAGNASRPSSRLAIEAQVLTILARPTTGVRNRRTRSISISIAPRKIAPAQMEAWTPCLTARWRWKRPAAKSSGMTYGAGVMGLRRRNPAVEESPRAAE